VRRYPKAERARGYLEGFGAASRSEFGEPFGVGDDEEELGAAEVAFEE
jgi:hypothetical protein